jgi:isopenicillin N synthase-like dioxygenase
MPDSPPLVDLRRGGPADLVSALIGCSCVLITGHGIDPELRRTMAEVSAAFFDLPRDEKRRVQWPGTGPWRGWQPVQEGVAELTGDRIPDLVERYEAQNLATFALWPERPVELREVWGSYYERCADLCSRLMGMLAEGLDLPGDELAAWTEHQYANLCVNNYPAQVDPPLPGQVRIGAHTDRGGITLLAADDAPGGLEVLAPGATAWMPVTIPADGFLIQIGDLFARWTNVMVHGNVHRVVNPPRELGAAARRQSVVFFHYPALDTVVTPAPSCVAATGGTPLPPLHAGEHTARRQAAYADDDEVRTGELHGVLP